jgi:hypothetical protein
MNNETHTPEPWIISGPSPGIGKGIDDGGDYAIIAGGHIIGETIHLVDHNEYRPAEANARRIVACVNACAGISDIEVIRIADMPRTALNARLELLRQRDELEAALLKCEQVINCYINGLPVNEWVPVRDSARAALAKLK